MPKTKTKTKTQVKTRAKTTTKTKAPSTKRKTTRKVSQPTELSEMPLQEVWKAYQRTDTQEIRNFLIEQYLHLVKSTAERMHMRLPGEVDVEDLMSAGLFGLMDAIDAFDLSRGVKFETYCTQRIRGAIFDELRAMDWVPRLVRSRTAKLDRVRKRFEMESGRKPTDKELRGQLQVLH